MMGEAFAAAWLEAREALDHAARSACLADRFAARLGAGRRLLDLGTGTGSNIRYLAPRLGPRQRWIALDHDPALLRLAARAFRAFADRHELELTVDPDALHLRGPDMRIEVVVREGDLQEVERALPPGRVDGVSASALLDLVSAGWLDALSRRLDATGLPALFALTFDGRLAFRPELDEDLEVCRRLIVHQHRDKGFGPALGPDAVAYLVDRLDSAGREVEVVPSDWHLTGATPELTLMFLDGLVPVFEQVPGRDLGPWLERRRHDLKAGVLEIAVGHRDMLIVEA